MLAALANGRQFSIQAQSTIYAIRISARVIGIGVCIAAITGVLSSLVANTQIARIDILASLSD